MGEAAHSMMPLRAYLTEVRLPQHHAARNCADVQRCSLQSCRLPSGFLVQVGKPFTWVRLDPAGQPRPHNSVPEYQSRSRARCHALL